MYNGLPQIGERGGDLQMAGEAQLGKSGARTLLVAEHRHDERYNELVVQGCGQRVGTRSFILGSSSCHGDDGPPLALSYQRSCPSSMLRARSRRPPVPRRFN
jgi:hypothetical protein